MTITQENAKRLTEIRRKMSDLLDEFKIICRQSMPKHEYDQFKYRTLGHIEPALNNETEWYTRYSSIDSLEKVAKYATDSVWRKDEEDYLDEDEEEDCMKNDPIGHNETA